MTDTAYDAGAPVGLSYEEELAQLRSGQNFALAIPAGIGAALVGALGWAIVAYLTKMELGLVAIGVGALVGYAIRTTGHGVDSKFAILGAACAAFGSALGMVLGNVATIAGEARLPVLAVAGTLGVSGSISVGIEGSGAMDLLFLAIAIWEGYKLSPEHRM